MQASAVNQKISQVVGTADSALITGIFSMFQNAELRSFLEETGHTYLFPAAMAFSVLQAILTARQAYLDKWPKKAIPGLIIETISAAAISTAVVGGLAASSAFAIAAPAIFVAALGIKTIFNASSAVYAGYKYLRAENLEKKQEYRRNLVAHSISTLSLTLATIAVGLVMLAAKPFFAFIGIIGGGIATLYSAYKALSRSSSKKQKPRLKTVAAEESAVNDNESSSPRIYHALNASPQRKQEKTRTKKRKITPPTSSNVSSFPGALFNHNNSSTVKTVVEQKLILDDTRPRKHA